MPLIIQRSSKIAGPVSAANGVASTGYVAGCLFRAVLLYAHALHGRAGRWLINEKGAIAWAGRLPVAPPGFATRALDVLAHLDDRPDQMKAAIGAGQALLDDVCTLVNPSQ